MALSDLIMGIINHQTEAEKAALAQKNAQAIADAQGAASLKYDPQISAATLVARNNAINGIGNNYGATSGLTPSIASTMVNSDGTYRGPEMLREAYQVGSDVAGGVPASATATQLAQNRATQGQAGLIAQGAAANTSPVIQEALATKARNEAQAGANASGYALDPENMSLASMSYRKGLEQNLATENRGILEAAQMFPSGSMYGTEMNPRTGVADIVKSPYTTPQQDIMANALGGGKSSRATYQPVYVGGKLVGHTPHQFNPEPEAIHTASDVVTPAVTVPAMGWNPSANAQPVDPSQWIQPSRTIDSEIVNPSELHTYLKLKQKYDPNHQVISGYMGM